MMKTNTVAVVVVMAVATCITAADSASDKFEIDVDAILMNRRILNNYLDCLLKNGRCTPSGKDVKRRLPEYFETNCGKCSAKEKTGAEKFIRFLAKNQPRDLDSLIVKYDRKNFFKTKHADYASSLGVAV